jgi:hypothetical protein
MEIVLAVTVLIAVINGAFGVALSRHRREYRS